MPPLSAANIHVADAWCHTAGAVKRSVPDGVEHDLDLAALCAAVPRMRATLRSRIVPSLPPCAM